jgi:hypothetical protein
MIERSLPVYIALQADSTLGMFPLLSISTKVSVRSTNVRIVRFAPLKHLGRIDEMIFSRVILASSRNSGLNSLAVSVSWSE